MQATVKYTAAALALASVVAATGHAIVQNKCAFPVYLWSVSNVAGSMQTVASGSSYSETYRVNPNGGGISIKIASSTSDGGPVTQFEYTYGNDLWYDISNINGYPFLAGGITATPSSPTCRVVKCLAGIQNCDSVYNVPDDNHATAMCDTNSDITLVLCSDVQGSSSAPQQQQQPTTLITSTSQAPTSATIPDFTPISALVSSQPSKLASVVPAPSSSSTVAPPPPPTTVKSTTSIPSTTSVPSTTVVPSTSTSAVIASTVTPVATMLSNDNGPVVIDEVVYFTTVITVTTTVDLPEPTYLQNERKVKRHNHYHHQHKHQVDF